MHQKIQDWGHALLAVAVGLLALAGALLFFWHVESATPWADMKAADWGVWVGGIGTVATLAVTIYLATESERRRRREQIDLAILSAAQFALQITVVRNALRYARDVLPDCLDGANPRQVFSYCVRVVETSGLWTANDLIPLVVLPNHTAAKLSMLHVRLDRTLVSLRSLGEGGEMDGFTRKRHFDVFSDRFDKHIATLAALQAECIEFLDQHDFQIDAPTS